MLLKAVEAGDENLEIDTIIVGEDGWLSRTIHLIVPVGSRF